MQVFVDFFFEIFLIFLKYSNIHLFKYDRKVLEKLKQENL